MQDTSLFVVLSQPAQLQAPAQEESHSIRSIISTWLNLTHTFLSYLHVNCSLAVQLYPYSSSPIKPFKLCHALSIESPSSPATANPHLWAWLVKFVPSLVNLKTDFTYLQLDIFSQRGLTGFVASRSNTLGQRISFPAPAQHSHLITIVIDASAFVYRISRLHIDWTRGGDSAAVQQILHAYITAFTNVGLKPVFVWDGPFDLAKLETVKSRNQASVRNVISFMRAGPSLRQNRAFQNEISVLPPLIMRACISYLRDLDVEQHFPAGEADIAIAELAIARNAYITSLDSDFFIISHGSMGYIPLDTLNFLSPSDSSDGNNDSDGGDWVPVRKGRSPAEPNYGNKTKLLLTTLSTLHRSTLLSCMLYKPTLLAAQLNLPSLTWLPLLAILSGTDYFMPPIWRTAGSPSAVGGKNTATARLELLARAMVKCGSGKGQIPLLGNLHAFLARVIEEVREFAMSDGEINGIVDRLLNCLVQYKTSRLSDPVFPDTSPAYLSSPLSVFLPNSPDDPNELIKTRLLNAHETGQLRRELLQVLMTGIYESRSGLEDPDCTSCVISCARPIRVWTWAVLHETVGICQPSVEMQQMKTAQETDHSENIKETTGSESKANAARSSRQAYVGEYVRRSAGLVLEEVEIPCLSTLLPTMETSNVILSRSTPERYKIFLHATSSSTPRLVDPSGPHIPLISVIATLRHLAFLSLDSKIQAWTPDMRFSTLCMAYLLGQGHVPSADTDIPTNGNIQYASQVTSTLTAVTMLSEALLLTSVIPPGERFFEGQLFHRFLDLSLKEMGDLVCGIGVDMQGFKSLVSMMEEGLPLVKEQKLSKVAKRIRKKDQKDTQVSLPLRDTPQNVFEMLSLAV